MLNASVMIAQAAIKVCMFHSRQFRALMMCSFFRPYEPFDDVTLDDIHLPFHPSMYPTDGESDSETGLTPTYLVGSDPAKPTYPSVIWLTSDSSSSSAVIHAPAPI